MKTIPDHKIYTLSRFILLFLIAFLFRIEGIHADIRYVDSAATGGNTGNSWVDAYPTLGQALTAANANMTIDSILVAKGTYYPTGAQTSTNRNAAFIITRDGLKLFGGFQTGGAGGWAARLLPTNGGIGGSVLSGDIYDGSGANNNSDNCYHVLICAGSSANPIDTTLRIDGFRIIGGNANGPLYNSYLNVNGASIRRDNGGGIYNHYASPVICNSLFSGNYAFWAGGMFNYHSFMEINKCRISGNHAYNGGGGMYNEYSPLKIINSTLSGNDADGSGSSYGNGGGMFNEYSSVVITNTTVSGNDVGNDGGGIFNYTGSHPVISNSIIYGNRSGIYNYGGSTVTAYSLVQGLTSAANGNLNGNTTNPLFVSPVSYNSAPTTAGDYHLQPASPCIDAGSNDSIPPGITTDLDGNPRMQGNGVDMGAYEFRSYSFDTTIQVICYADSLPFRGAYYSTSGYFTDTVTQPLGWDSLYVLDLTVLPPADTVPVQTLDSCYQVTFEGNVFLSDTILGNVYSYASIACDSAYREVQIHIFHPDTIALAEAICFGDTLFIASQPFYASGQYQVLLSNSSGCDSVINLQLQVNPIKDTLITGEICAGDIYLFAGQNLSAAGTYVDTIFGGSVSGCDSIVTLNLTVNPIQASTINQTICSNDAYNFNGQNLTTTGTYYDTLQTISGCDSIITLHLIVNPVLTTTLNESICSNGSYNFNGQNLTATGIYYDTLQTVAGCDSIIILNLIVNPVLTTTLNESICSNDFYSFNGQNLSTPGTYYDTLQTVAGCDSIIILNLTIHQVSATTLNESICNNGAYNFNGQALTAAGTYYDTLQTIFGCDSIITLHLTVNPVLATTLSESICSNGAYNFNGQILNIAGTYHDTLQTVAGCDSVITLHLTVKPAYDQSFTLSLCTGSLPYIFGTQSLNAAGIYTETFMTTQGCDSIVHITLNVNPEYDIDDTITVCENTLPHAFGVQNLTAAGNYTELFSSVYGCDSLVHLTLLVHPTLHTQTGVTTCAASLPYVFGSQSLLAPGSYTEVFSATTGCDSIVDLSLAILPLSGSVTIDTSACGSVVFEGVTYNQSTILQDTLYYAQGCDSVYRTVNIQVWNPTLITQTLDSANCDVVSYEGKDYYSDTLLDKMFTDMHGCDSLLRKMYIHVRHSVKDTIVADICRGESYLFNGMAYNTPGIYSAVFPYWNGCDSSMTIVLQVHEPPSVRIHVEDKPGGYCIGDEIKLNGEGAVQYHWKAGYGKDYGAGMEVQVLLMNSIDTFFVKATNEWGCPDSAFVQIDAGHCCQVFVPNAFSPNGDGLNDGFGVETNGHPRGFVLQIFNRMGKRIFIGYKPGDKWDGTVMGQPAPMDTYYYVVTGSCVNGSSIKQKGEFHLIR